MTERAEDPVEALFDQAVALPPEARVALLDQVCRDNPELRAEVESLLACDGPTQASGTLLHSPVVRGLSASPSFGPPASSEEVGTLGPYRIVKALGHGGMGAVYDAFDTRLHRRIALKVMLPQFADMDTARQRFLREARATARVCHENVVTVYEADERDGVPYIAMQLLEGRSLEESLRQNEAPDLATILRIARETAEGLAAAHAFGLVHRDVKPANLWLEAPTGRVKVLDFGLARPIDTDIEVTIHGAVVGTPAYMSPEQARGENVTLRTDLFSLGVVLYRLCSGRLPFDGPTTLAVLTALGTQEPTPLCQLNPDIPPPLADLIHQLLAKNVEDRPNSAAEVVQRLNALDGRLETASSLAILGGKPTRRNVTRLLQGSVVAISAVFALILVGVVILIRNKDGSVTKYEVPDDAAVTIKGKDGNTIFEIGPGDKPPAAIAKESPDRKVAGWVLSLGGYVCVNGVKRHLTTVTELPRDPFTVTEVGLAGSKTVTDANISHLKDLQGLKDLTLHNTSVTDAGLIHLMGLKGLTELHLGGTQVTDSGLVALKDLTGLTSLSLEFTRVTDAGLIHLKGLTGLKRLKLSNTQIADAGLVHLQLMRELRRLDLGETRVSDVGLEHLKALKELTLLKVQKTRVTARAVTDFRSVVRGCLVEHNSGLIGEQK